MRHWPEDIVEQLRTLADMEALELGEPVEEFIQHDAADYIEHLRAALERVAEGSGDAAEIAKDALDDRKWAAR